MGCGHSKIDEENNTEIKMENVKNIENKIENKEEKGNKKENEKKNENEGEDEKLNEEENKEKESEIEEESENNGILNRINIIMDQALMPIFIFEYNDNKGVDLDKISYGNQNHNDNRIKENIPSNDESKNDEVNLQNSESFDFDEEIKEDDSKGDKINELESEDFQKIIMKNILGFLIVFGNNVKKKFFNFLKNYNIIMEYAYEIETEFYCLSYDKVKSIIAKCEEKKGKEIIINDKFYNLLVNDLYKIKKYKSLEDIYEVRGKSFKLVNDLHKELINSIIKLYMLSKQYNNSHFIYSLMKYFQDIGFCLKFFLYQVHEMLYGNEFLGYEYHHDIRILHFSILIQNLANSSKIPSDILNLATESAKVKDTIIIGDNEFINHIKSLNLFSKRINELDEKTLESFFKKPFKEENKYKVIKYFIICDENVENIYLEKIRSLSIKYGFAYLFLIYSKNEKTSREKTNIRAGKQKPIIYIYNDYELIEFYKDNNERLKPCWISSLPNTYFTKNDNGFGMDSIMNILYKNIDEFKSNCEDGWEIFELKNEKSPHKLIINKSSFHDFINETFINIMESYKENNTLEIFFKHYAQYFFLILQPEFIVNMTAYAKMFLHAYTLEEKDPKKNLYCLINNDLRSSDHSKINRHFNLIKLIGGLVLTKRLKSFEGNVYRAAFLKDELINKIKVGSTITNSSFWSTTKKESFAKKYLKKSFKNALVITKAGETNNVDIHSEGISKYAKEEEVLFLPFCKFKVIGFEKIEEENNVYYKLTLESDSKKSLIEPFREETIEALNFENTYY